MKRNAKRRLLPLAMTLAVLLAGCGEEPRTPAPEPAAEVEAAAVSPDELPPEAFQDPALEQAIRKACGKMSGTLTQADLDRIERLVLNGTGLRSLSGLEYCRHLRELHLPHNGLAHVEPLGELSELRLLNLAGNEGLELTPLQTLTELGELNLSGCELSSVKALEPLIGLTILDLSQNHIEDVTPLGNMTQMSMLTLTDNPLDGETLKALQNLKAGAVILEQPEP